MRKVLCLGLLLALMVLSFLAGRHYTQGNARAVTNARRVLYYVDPMHPSYKSDKPGIAPDCGMKLEPVYADGDSPDNAASIAAGTVNINPEQQQMIGVRTAEVEKTAGEREVRVLGRVAPDETRIYRLTAATEGYIRDTSSHSNGSMVMKGERLASFGSVDLLTAEQSFIIALSRSPETRIEVANEAAWRNQTVKVAGEKLRAYGMSETQLQEIAASKLVSDAIQIVSPVSGFIVARNVSPGLRFDKGMEFYRIVDLSRVWILADIYESEAQYFRPGVIAKVTLPNQGKTLRARVSEVLPQFDGSSRTLKVRLEADNPGFALRPDMFVDVELPVPVPPGLSVPADALIDSGLSKRVYVDKGNGIFEPREVETGWRAGDRVEIVKGLSAGERVVASGTFLVDSESRLKATAAGNRGPTEPMEKHDHAAPEMKQAKMAAKTTVSSAKDLACGMDVKPGESIGSGNAVEYHGTTYYFCSTSCKTKFQKDPEHYLASSHQGNGQ